MNTKQELYAVIGNPIGHSKSPLIQMLYAKQTKQDLMKYEPICFEIDAFQEGLKEFISRGGLGANVTAPFKQDAWAACDSVSAEASLAGAVNTLSFSDGKIVGDNTDGLGLVSDLQVNHNVLLKNKKILIIGAGGAVRGILKPIIDCQPKSITVANRTVSKAAEFTDIFSDYFHIKACSLESINESYDLIINGTSASISNELPAVSELIVGPHTVVYDMMYSSSTTVFNGWAQSLGARKVIDGLGMLIGQAAESFFIWRGVKPDAKCVIEHIRSTL